MAGELKEFKASFGVNASVAEPVKNQTPKRKADKRNPEKSKPSQGSSCESTPGQGGATRAEMVDYMVDQLKQLTNEEVQELFDQMTNEVNEDDQNENQSKDLSSYKITSQDIDIEEDLNALFGGAELSDEFKVKARTIFETAVVNKVNDVVSDIEQDASVILSEAVAENQDELVDNVDRYLTAVASKWIEDNQIAVTNGLKTEIAENFIVGLRNLFAESYIEVPEEKADAFEAMAEEIERLEQMLNEQLEENISLKEVLESKVRDDIIESAGEDLTDSQFEKLKSLSENLSFEDPETFQSKVATLKESYLTEATTEKDAKPKSNAEIPAESEDDEPVALTEELTGPMAGYLKTLQRTVPKNSK